MDLVGIIASPQVGMGFQPSEIWAMEICEIVYWGEQIEKIAKMMAGK